MVGKLEFFSSRSVGERGQVLVPIELRKKMQLHTGDKLIAMGTMGDNMVLILKAGFLTQIFGRIEKEQNELRKILKDNTDIESYKDNELTIN